jgi:hypothetical protein
LIAMMKRRDVLVGAAAGLGGLVAASPAAGQEILADLPLDQHGWSAAPQVGDSIGWEVLGATQESEAQVNGQLWIVPRFTRTVRALHGRRVRINGYMMEWEATPRQSRFLLLAYPTTCPFHMMVGPAFCVDVRSPGGVLYQERPVLVEGILSLLDQDAEGLFYRLTEAREVS